MFARIIYVIYLKASPLPPAPLATSRFVICNLNGSAGFERSAGLESFKIFQNWTCVQANLHSQIKRIEIWFQADLHSKLLIFIGLGHHFGGILGSWGTTLAPFWWSLGARVHSVGSLNVPTSIFCDFLWFLGDLLEPLWSHFFTIQVIWGMKKHVWIADTILHDFWLEIWLISDVPTSQKYGK